VSWDSFVRRYNADLANDFGNLVNRTVSMANRYLDGERPDPVPETEGRLSWSWSSYAGTYAAEIEDCMLHDALGLLFGNFVGEANQFVDAEQPWALAKQWKAGDEVAGERLRGVLGDLVEACRLVALAAAPFMPSIAPRVLEQLGYEYPYAADGNGGPPLLDELAWGAHAGESGRLGPAAPLFPRLEGESAANAAS
jgi:methionyl-tRNA synthetase